MEIKTKKKKKTIWRGNTFVFFLFYFYGIKLYINFDVQTF